MQKNWSKVLEEVNKQSLMASETERLKFWKEKNILGKSIENRSEDKRYTFYDGPITANNKPHYGHALTMTLKDVVPRYWTMKGYKVSRSLGWDCQGIPVEYEVEKTLGLKHKKEIEEFGVEKFNKLCRESVEKYQKDIFDLTERMGRWVNKDEEFATMDSQYVESVWWSLKELYNKDLLYQGYKVVPYSTRAGTTLSNSEVALGGYEDIVDPAVTIKFKVKGDSNKYLLAWTTTPWTLPGNLLLAVMNDADYVEVKSESNNGEVYILAKSLIDSALGKDTKYEIVKEMKGSDLVGMEYEPLFDYYADRKEQGAFKVVSADHVTLDDGTGIVHQAPYGEEDFALLTKMGIQMFDYLDDTGHFTKPVTDYEGQFYKGANSKIMEELKTRNLLFNSKEYTHRMPMCWRTGTPLIYKPVKSWYVKVTNIVDDMVKQNNEIKWVPKHIKEGRFGNWLVGARDWALSRNRYWGTPLPVWICNECENVEVLGSFAEIKEKSGIEITDPHKPFIDNVKYKCDCGGEMVRVNEVIDVWYDSGAMPFARFHYPFENKDLFAKKFPAQYIAEGIDQTRGWFYTLHVLGVALFGSKAFENVIVNGMVLNKEGAKMSKSKRNYTEIDLVLNQFGSDPLRLYFLNTPISRGQDVAFDEKFLKEINATTILPLWNSVKYFVNYAKTNNWEYNEKEFGNSTNLMDKWVIAKLKDTVNTVNKYMEAYNLQKATSCFTPFIDDMSKWYIRGSRDRFVSGDKGALNTLYFALMTLSKILAPFAPFLAEDIYQVLRNDNDMESVHLTDFPVFEKLSEEESRIVEQMSVVRDLSNLGQSLRVEKALKLRQPLEKVSVKGVELDKEYADLLIDELNVKTLVKEDVNAQDQGWVTSESKGISLSLFTTLSEELIEEGLYREIVRTIQNARKETNLTVGEKVRIELHSNDELVKKVLENNNESFVSDVSASSVTWSNTTLDNEVKVGEYNLSYLLTK